MSPKPSLRWESAFSTCRRNRRTSTLLSHAGSSSKKQCLRKLKARSLAALDEAIPTALARVSNANYSKLPQLRKKV